MGRSLYSRRIVVKLLLVMLTLPQLLFAQHAIDIQRHTLEGEHFRALVLFDKMAKRRGTIDAKIAAAKSAWALGLPERAIAEFDEVLRRGKLTTETRARILLSRGSLEFQEERYSIALVYAKKVIDLLPTPSPLRAKALVLAAESLFEDGSFGAAQSMYTQALAEASEEMTADIHYLLGRCLVKLDKTQEAAQHFESLPLSHVNSPRAIRELSHIAFARRNFEDVEFWLTKGKEHFPDHFIDSWVEYALVHAAMQRNDGDAIVKIKEEATQKYPPSDHWLNLLNSAVEGYYWQRKAKFQEGHNG